MVDAGKLQAVYDKRLKRLKDLRRRQEEEKEFMSDKICDYLDKVLKRANSDLVDIINAALEEHPKGEGFPKELHDEVMEVSKLASEIIMKRYDHLEY
ncbi:MAG: hypothetical protein LUD47_07760 [Clostridia bacterium]|nr:hypothetical protein [Clostridia bacterium]